VPPYEAPQVEMPTQWRHAAPSATATATSDPANPAPAIPAEWWTAFGSEELARLQADAARNNTDLRAAAARIVQAATQVRAAGSALYPTIGASGGVGRTGSFSRNIDARSSYD